MLPKIDKNKMELAKMQRTAICGRVAFILGGRVPDESVLPVGSFRFLDVSGSLRGLDRLMVERREANRLYGKACRRVYSENDKMGMLKLRAAEEYYTAAVRDYALDGEGAANMLLRAFQSIKEYSEEAAGAHKVLVEGAEKLVKGAEYNAILNSIGERVIAKIETGLFVARVAALYKLAVFCEGEEILRECLFFDIYEPLIAQKGISREDAGGAVWSLQVLAKQIHEDPVAWNGKKEEIKKNLGRGTGRMQWISRN